VLSSKLVEELLGCGAAEVVFSVAELCDGTVQVLEALCQRVHLKVNETRLSSLLFSVMEAIQNNATGLCVDLMFPPPPSSLRRKPIFTQRTKTLNLSVRTKLGLALLPALVNMICGLPRGLALVQRQSCELVNECLDNSLDLKNLLKSKQYEKVLLFSALCSVLSASLLSFVTVDHGGEK